ncbi:MAG: hypothetical protein IPI79_13260 [Moraxellaceae bacterium]|nr:hypothetical protein [Moraxellaceae bacterium]
MLLFAPYEKNSLKNDPVVSMLGKWEIHYLAFEGPQDCQKPPVIVLGGAFQNFTSYRFLPVMYSKLRLLFWSIYPR